LLLKPGDTITMTNDLTAALRELSTSLLDLRAARLAASRATDKLTGARHTRAEELTTLLTEAISHCSRLHTCVTGDCRASQAELLP
jgi:hypothetical protein